MGVIYSIEETNSFSTQQKMVFLENKLNKLLFNEKKKNIYFHEYLL